MESLFVRMESYYGAKFANAWAGVDRRAMKRQWAMDLWGLRDEELRAGVVALKSHAFPPTLPEFLAMCRPPLNVDAALYEATQQLRLRAEGRDEWSNPAIYWAALKIGEFDMLNLSHSALLKRFGDALAEVMRQTAIAPVPPRAVQLPAPGRGSASREKVAQVVEKVKALKKPVANTAWADKILARVANGESVGIAVVTMAKAAKRVRVEA